MPGGDRLVRQDNWRNTLVIDNGPPIIMDTFKGGDNDSDAKIWRPGGMVQAKVVGGFQTVSNITLDKGMDGASDWTVLGQLMRVSPGRSSVQIVRQPLDENGADFGRPLVYTGVCKQVIPGDTDSNKADPIPWSVVCVCNSNIG